MDNQELEFAEEWLELEKYHFKILTIATILADENRAYRGKISDFCEQIGVQNSSANRTKIKNSLLLLADNDYIRLIIDKDIYTISLAKSIEKSKNIIKIKKAWYKLIRDNKNTASWENTLKVFLVLLELPNNEVITYDDIGTIVGIKKSTVKNCVNVLKKINFKDFVFSIELERVQLSGGEYRTKGQIYNQMIIFE